MKHVLLWILCVAALPGKLQAAESWPEALRLMPLSQGTTINRDNCLPLLLRSFQSNEVVRALLVLPAVSDDFYLINRDRPQLNLKAANLLEAISGLTNATQLRVLFQEPFLLLHMDRDGLKPNLNVKHKSTAERLKHSNHLPRALWSDAHWTRVQPELRGSLGIQVLPDAQSNDAWHFPRFNLAAWNLTDWELLPALSLAGKIMVTIQKDRVVFRLEKSWRGPAWGEWERGAFGIRSAM